MNRSSRKSYLLVACIGFLMPFLTGFLGLLPLDQSILFEAGGRIAKGEVPFTDFYLPYGLVPALIQSIFFKIFSSTWFAYIFHAAVINSLFGYLLLDTLRMWLPQERITRLMFITLVAAWSFYPMMGTPFMDNHSFFFGFLSYWSILSAVERRNPWMLLFSFSFLVLGFYSKPLPVIFWILPVVLELWLSPRYILGSWTWVVTGFVVALFILFLPLLVFNPDQFYYYTFQLPFNIGKARMIPDSDGKFLISLLEHERYKIWLGFLTIILLYFFFKVRRQEKNIRLAFYRSSSILLASVIGAALTKNTFYNLLTTAVVISFGVLTCFDFKNGYSSLHKKFNKATLGLGWAFFIIVITWLNFSRRANELVFYVTDLKKFSRTMGIFPKTTENRYTPDDLDRLYSLMKKENSLYIGDMMFLYSLTGTDNPWPISHHHDGTSYDSRDSLRFHHMKRKFINNVSRYGTSVIVNDILLYGEEPFAQFANQLKGKERERIGNFVVYEIDKGKLAWMVSSLNISLAR